MATNRMNKEFKKRIQEGSPSSKEQAELAEKRRKSLANHIYGRRNVTKGKGREDA